jgi:hypothetical protein
MEHLQEMTKVATINIAAFIFSWTNVDSFFRTAGLIVAFIYTCLKIIDVLRKWNK